MRRYIYSGDAICERHECDILIAGLCDKKAVDYILTGAIKRKESVGAHYIVPDKEK